MAPKLPTPPKPPAFPSGIKPSTLPGATNTRNIPSGGIAQPRTTSTTQPGVMGSSYVPGSGNRVTTTQPKQTTTTRTTTKKVEKPAATKINLKLEDQFWEVVMFIDSSF
jgi:hypothetical protein